MGVHCLTNPHQRRLHGLHASSVDTLRVEPVANVVEPVRCLVFGEQKFVGHVITSFRGDEQLPAALVVGLRSI